MGKMTVEDKKWQTEEDLRTLARAEEIKKDKARFAACKAMARTKVAEMQAMMNKDGK